MKIRFLSADDVRKALPMADAIVAMKAAYAGLSTGQVNMPLRTGVDVAEQAGKTLVMPAYLRAEPISALGVKIVSVFPENVNRGEPVIYALVMALDAATGRPLCIMEGGSLTAIRTGAASGAATDILARPEAGTLAVFGSGVQARTQLQAVCTVRNIQEVRVFSLDSKNIASFVQDVQGQGPIPENVKIGDLLALGVSLLLR